jgi:hypothetical protein
MVKKRRSLGREAKENLECLKAFAWSFHLADIIDVFCHPYFSLGLPPTTPSSLSLRLIPSNCKADGAMGGCGEGGCVCDGGGEAGLG